MPQKGQNNGVTGIIDLVPQNSTQSFPSIQCDIQGFALALTPDVEDVTGPGANFAKIFHTSNVDGSGSFNGFVQSNQRPFPPTMHNLQGTLTHQADTNCKIAFPAIITTLNCQYPAKETDTWRISGEWKKNGGETITWNGTTTGYTQPTLITHEVNAGTTKVDDPDSLTRSSTQKVFFSTQNGTSNVYDDAGTAVLIATYQGTATPPRTGLKWNTSTFIRIDDSCGWLIIEWKERDSADDVTFPASFSVRTASEANIDHDGEIVNSTTQSLFDHASTLFTAFRSTPFAQKLTLSQLTDAKRLVVYEYLNPGATLDGRTTNEYLEAKANGTMPQLFILSNIAMASLSSSGLHVRKIRFSRVKQVGALIRRFILFRVLTSSVIPEQNPQTINGTTLPLVGQINSTSFLGNGTNGGLAAGTVLYVGPRYKINIGLVGSNFTMAVGYEFFSSTTGIVDGVPSNLFWGENLYSSSSNYTGTGWTNINQINLPTSIIVPQTASFDAFVSGI